MNYDYYKASIKVQRICLDFKWATRLNRITLSLVGIWPNAHKNAYDKFLSNVRMISIFIAIVFMGVIPLTYYLMEFWGDLTITIDNLQFTAAFAMTTLKLLIMWWKKTGGKYEITNYNYN